PRLMPLLAALALLAAAPSVLVRTETPRAGRLGRQVVGYGTARPAPDGIASIVVQHAGIVAALAIVPGQRVAAGDTLATIAAAPAVRAQYRQTRASLALARAERAHLAQLRAQHLATASQLAAADKAVTDAAAALEALRREGGGAARQVLRAPFAGIVVAVGVAQGEAVAAGTPLFRLARAGAFLIDVGLPPAAAASVRVGQTARIAPLAGGAGFAGTVRGVGGMVDPASHLVEVTLAPAANDPPLPGASFRAAIRTGWYRGWIVPRDAVMSGPDGDFVFQVAGGHAVRVPVHVVGETGGETAIAGPLDPARALVTEGAYQLASGMAVRQAPASSHR
ncbi:MAG: efflux RND transporter periplasmic adaptor subunit, partial [Rhodospirillales bacterium]|nr:efflux RND transporter periplasmic adaptor subunit [Rhodospirillales bacterium]